MKGALICTGSWLWVRVNSIHIHIGRREHSEPQRKSSQLINLRARLVQYSWGCDEYRVLARCYRVDSSEPRGVFSNFA